MDTPERPQYPLWVAREVAQRVLTEFAADQRLAPGNRRTPGYWEGRLAESLRQMVSATSGETEDPFCEKRGPLGRFRCTLPRGHAFRHEAGGTSPLATWRDGDTEFTYEPEGGQS